MGAVARMRKSTRHSEQLPVVQYSSSLLLSIVPFYTRQHRMMFKDQECILHISLNGNS